MKICTNNRCRGACNEEGILDVLIVAERPVGGQKLQYQCHMYCIPLTIYDFISTTLYSPAM